MTGLRIAVRQAHLHLLITHFGIRYLGLDHSIYDKKSPRESSLGVGHNFKIGTTAGSNSWGD